MAEGKIYRPICKCYTLPPLFHRIALRTRANFTPQHRPAMAFVSSGMGMVLVPVEFTDIDIEAGESGASNWIIGCQSNPKARRTPLLVIRAMGMPAPG